MNLALINVAIFVLFGFYGWCQEMFLGIITGDKAWIAKMKCGDRSTGKFCVPFLFLYGWGALTMFNGYMILRKRLSKWSIIALLTALVIFIECLGAVYGKHVYGQPGWNYGTPVCYGGIAFGPSIFWLLLVTVGVHIFEYVVPKLENTLLKAY